MQAKKLTDIDIEGKTVLLRQDLNVPIRNGQVTSNTRIVASIPTIQYALAKGASVLVMSHLGRPVEGEFNQEFSLQPVADQLSRFLGKEVKLNRSYLECNPQLNPGEVQLLENVRFNSGEKSNNKDLGKRYAELCDVFVMDAFGTAHRAQASTHCVGQYANQVCAGPLLVAELEALDKALSNPNRPMVAIVGGSKVSTKLTVLKSLFDKVDQLIPGGGIANTFIAATGHSVGQSLYEPDLVETARELMALSNTKNSIIPIPVDVKVAKSFSEDETAVIKKIDQVEDNELILDIGPETARWYSDFMKAAGTIVWNGPVGVFEFPQFSEGTKVIGEAIANSNAFSLAGGGDTLAAIDKFELSERISYISTGGGAFLEFLEGKTLPSVEMLELKSNQS